MLIPVGGHPLHTRSLTMKVTALGEERWSASGQVIDLRKTGFAPLNTGLQPAGIIHHMCLDLRVHAPTLRIEALQAAQPVVAIEPSERSCGESCRDPVGRLDALVGDVLDDQFRARLSAAFGGPRGCSHLLALFQFMARALPRLVASQAQVGVESPHGVGEAVFQSALFIDGHYTEQREFELCLQLSDFLVRPEQHVAAALERYQYERALRLHTIVEPPAMQLRDSSAALRERTLESLHDARFDERPQWAAALDGRAMMQGLSSGIAARFAQDGEDGFFVDAIAQLAPGFIQVLAAVADQWIARTRSGEDAVQDRPLGGGVDSCYIWREGGGVSRQG